jgi:hypothetical protein
MKKIVSMVLAFVMVIGVLPMMGALLVAATGFGSNGMFLMPIAAPAAGSTPISDRAGLEAIRNNLGGTYHLTANIDLFGTEWTPIGGKDVAFTGVFDGQGFVIRNLTITGNVEFAGLFGRTSDAIIRDVGLEDTNINVRVRSGVNQTIFAGGITGHNSGIIINCYNTGSVSSSVPFRDSNSHSGGICGYNATSGSVSSVFNTGSVSASVNGYVSSPYAGGVVGYNVGAITNSYNIGSITASGFSMNSTRNAAYAGGISGYNLGSVITCYNAGAINSNAPAYSGGISGYNAGLISDTYNIGMINSSSPNVLADTYSGGVCGHNAAGGSIANSYNAGEVHARSNRRGIPYAGGTCAHNEGSITRSFWSIDSAQTLRVDQLSNDEKKGVGRGTDTTTSRTTAQLQSRATYASWTDFGIIWGFKPGVNNGFPVLRVFHPDIPPEAPNLNAASTWAFPFINTAFNHGIIPNSLQNNYTSNTTRAEFCALAVALYETVTGRVITERMTFIDTDDVNVQKMGALGVVSGVGGNRFDPNARLTREQAAVILSRLADALGKSLPREAATFADNARIASWAINQAGHVQAAGIMGGVGANTFAPQDPYTREQSITTMVRMWDWYNR